MAIESLLNENWFELFSLPIRFELDMEGLEQKRKELLLREHPDHCQDSEGAKNKTAVIHQAYQMLRNPILRSEYLAHLLQIPNLSPNNTLNPEILEQTWKWREDMDAIGSVKAWASLKDQIQGVQASLMSQLAHWWHEFFASEGRLGECLVLYQTQASLKLLDKLLEDVDFQVWQASENSERRL
ncbi:MAG: hypothetical protein QM520_02990 [Gammaproteobacteria bacterium]|nr:hypothetical protein [Gammaproteobacteria bacterium]